MKEYFEELIKEIKSKKLDREQISKLKNKLASKHNLKKPPTNIEVLLNAQLKDIAQLKKYIITKPTRTISGVAVIAIMTKPFSCPHAKKGGPCTMCPGGPASVFGDVPQSYTGNEPATMRGIRNFYDPYLQVFNRLEQYVVLGHNPDKVELIVMGGTFPSFPKKYQEEFIMYSFKAMNDFSKMFYKKDSIDLVKFKEFFELPGDIYNKNRVKSIQRKLLNLKSLKLNKEVVEKIIKNKYKKTNTKKPSIQLEKEQVKNETAIIRCVGLTQETRPDYGKLVHGNEMLRLGTTRVEIGVQSVYEDVLKKIKRGHSVKDTIESIRILKDLGFKINAHYMPGLTSRKRDLDGMKKLFDSSDFRPDMLKIYPCMVLKGTKLFDLWKKGKYKPLSTKKAASLIADLKQFVPEYVRIMRVQRDISPKVIEAGVKKTNLRQYVDKIIKDKNIICNCIRCREVGRAKKIAKPFISINSYEASKGQEFFISFVDKYNNLFGFCRLRFPFEQLRKEITKNSALIRELHVYGPATQIGKKGSIQHKGLGKQLVREAEKIARENNKDKMVVISGIGVKKYYKKLGYKKQGPYMVKAFDN